MDAKITLTAAWPLFPHASPRRSPPAPAIRAKEGSAREGNGEGLCRQLWIWGEMLGQHGLARLAGPVHGPMESIPCVGLTMCPAGFHANPGSALAPTMTKYAQNHLKRFSGTPCAYKQETDCHRVRPEPNCSSRVPSGRLQNGGSLRAPSRPELQLPAAPAPRPARWERWLPRPLSDFFCFPLGASAATNQCSALWGSPRRNLIKKNKNYKTVTSERCSSKCPSHRR